MTDAKQGLLSAERLAEIRARLDAATPGPWKLCPMELYIFGGDGHMIAWDEDPESGTVGMRGAGAERSGQRPAGTMERNADLIAHAPADIRALCDAVEALRAERDALLADPVRRFLAIPGIPMIVRLDTFTTSDGHSTVYHAHPERFGPVYSGATPELACAAALRALEGATEGGSDASE